MGKLIAGTTASTRSSVRRGPAPSTWAARPTRGSRDLGDSIPKLKDEVDEYEIYLNPVVWGEGNVHVLGDRGTVRLTLGDVKRFDSGVVLLTYLPAT